MVVVLHLISLAMALGGAAAISYGSGIISLERGWTMVIAGTVTVAGGCVLLGVATVAARVGAVAAELRRVHEGLAGLQSRPEPAPSGAPASAPPERRVEEEARRPDIPEPDRFSEPDLGSRTPSRWRERAAARALASATTSAEPSSIPGTFEPTGALAHPAPTGLDFHPTPTPARAREPSVFGSLVTGPLGLPTDGTDSSRAASRTAWDALPVEGARPLSHPRGEWGEDAGASLAGPASGDLPGSSPEPANPTTLHDAPPSQSEEQAPAQPNSPTSSGEDANQSVVGSYSSGDNSYVMYADGSIRANTPTGEYRFTSLDDLKNFLAKEPETGSTPPA